MQVLKSVKKPILRYYGGKWMLAPWVIENMPDHKRYVEPYCGAASVLMRKPPSKVEAINDKYDRIVNIFRVLRDPKKAARLKELLALTPYSKTEFYAAFEQSDDPVEDARRMLILSGQGIGGRFHRTGWSRLISSKCSPTRFTNIEHNIDNWVTRLKNVMIDNEDSLTIIKKYDSHDTLFYVDPPYLKTSRSIKSDIYQYESTEDDHINLAETLHKINGMVMLSGYPSDLYNELYQDWQMLIKESLNQSGQKTTEVLWLSPSITNHRDPVDEVISRLFIEKT